MDKFSNINKKLEQYNQEHIINLCKNFTDVEKEKIYEQIDGLNLEQIDKLYDELSNKEKVDSSNVQEIEALNTDNLTAEELKEYYSTGEKILKSNQYALVTMSGGQGTRLGYDKPKGTFKIDIQPKPKYLFEILADKLKIENKKYNNIIPWYIMTSKENDKQIKDFFNQHNYFDYPREFVKFFEQNNLPLITENKKLII